MDDAVKAWKISILVFGPLREHIGNQRIELSVVTKTTVTKEQFRDAMAKRKPVATNKELN